MDIGVVRSVYASESCIWGLRNGGQRLSCFDSGNNSRDAICKAPSPVSRRQEFVHGLKGLSLNKSIAGQVCGFGREIESSSWRSAGKVARGITACAGVGAVRAMEETGKVKREAHLQVFENVEKLGISLAQHVAQLSEAAVQNRGVFSVVLSGGSLIKTLGKLCEPPYLEKVDWSRWHVFWVDERVVKKDHPDSNYKLAYDGLLAKVLIPSGQVYAINDALSAQGAAEDYEVQLRQLVKTSILPMADTNDYPRFDLILLGMGPDGHLASLFPHHPLVHEKKLWVTSITDSPKPPPERITFTFPVINSAANVSFVATGEGKADVLAKVFGEELPFGTLPSQSVYPVKGKLIWFADKAATSKL